MFLARRPAPTGVLSLVAKYSTGFVYLVSRTGVTGEQTSVAAGVEPLIDRMRAVTDLPLAVGFGIAKPEHAREVGEVADAVVVGSAIVRMIEKYGEDPQLLGNLKRSPESCPRHYSQECGPWRNAMTRRSRAREARRMPPGHRSNRCADRRAAQ